MKIQKTRARIVAFFSGFILSGVVHAAAESVSAPAEQQPATDVYHHVTVTDPYRWLENGADPKVHEWSATQDRLARKYLDSLPLRAPIFTQLFSQFSATSSSFAGLRAVGDSVFAYYSQPPKQQPMIALLTNAADPALARVIVDPERSSMPKGTTAIDWFVPSPDGKMLAVSMSENGSEDGTLHLFDVASGKQVGAPIPRVQYPDRQAEAWRGAPTARDSGTRATRERIGRRRNGIFSSRSIFIGWADDPAKDAYVLGKDFPKVAEIELDTRFNPQLVIVSVANGDGGEFAHYVIEPTARRSGSRGSKTRWSRRRSGADDTLYLVSRTGAPRGKLLKLPPGVSGLSRARQRLFPKADAVLLGERRGRRRTRDRHVERAVRARTHRRTVARRRISITTASPQGMLPLPDVAAVE